ncbi:mRNA binding protein puf3 [Sporothrix epigloea]|uniref:mRNA binding protein puf3 n=1 Tax=Sporothrix epigloea TaxID=1892477 RepID=A0ABP0DG09_9PEZI
MANQSTRFPYGKVTPKQPPTQSLPSNSFQPATNWQSSNVWGNSMAAPANNREPNAPRGKDEPFADGHPTKTFSTNPSTSNVWAQQPNPWNNTDNITAVQRTASSPSPARQRQNAKDIPNAPGSTPSLYAIGHNGAYSTGRTRAVNGTSIDASNDAYYFKSPLHDSIAGDESDSNTVAASLSKLRLDSEALPYQARAIQNPPNVFSASAAGVAAGQAASASSAPGPLHGPANNNINTNGIPFFGSFGPVTSASHGHSHRASMHSSTSYPSPAESAYALPLHRDSQPEDPSSLAMSQIFRHSQAFDERTAHPSTSGAGTNFAAKTSTARASRKDPPQAPFRFNPFSEPWHTSIRGLGMPGQGSDAATDPAFPASQGQFSAAERGNPPIGDTFLQQSSSPQDLGSPVNPRPWSRPQFCAPRMPGLPDSSINGARNIFPRQPLQHFLHDQQMSAAATAATLYNGNPNFLPANLVPYPVYSSFRPPTQMHPSGVQHGAPIGNPSMPGSHIPMPRGRDVVRSMRSPVLEDFRSSRANRRFELRDIYGYIVEFSGDQHGSRFIQSKLETANSDEKEHIFHEISANALVLMRDVFGNYVVQKFFEHGSQVQKKYLAEQMRGKMVELSTQAYACRVVQKALEHILVDQQIVLVKELEVDITRVIKDPSGNHVVQKVIEVVPREYIGFVMEALSGKVKELSSHNYGCRVVQRMLERGSEEDKAVILAELRAHARDLIMDQYGNYVTQHVIEFGEPKDRSYLINTVLSELVPMSRHKFASNVVEKCMEYGTVDDHIRARRELEKVGNDGVPVLHQMIKDQYGNYVIQRLLKLLEGEERRLFVATMESQLAVLKRTSTGRQSAAIDRLLDELARSCFSNAGSFVTKSCSASTAPASPRLPTNSDDSTPPLTNAPNSPESTNPPSVSAGPTRDSMATEAQDKRAVAEFRIAVSSDADASTAE